MGKTSLESNGLRQTWRVVLAHTWLLALLLPFSIAQAQQPTDAQRNAIRSACRSDFMKQCSSVKPGGIEALTCLQQHNSTLSPACRSAVAAISTGKVKSSAVSPAAPADGASASATAAQTQAVAPAAVAAPAARPAMPSFSPGQEMIVMRRSCGPDFRSLCSMVPLGGGRGIACLRDNMQRLSPTCQRVLTSGL